MTNTIKVLLVTAATIIFLIPFTFSSHAKSDTGKGLKNKSVVNSVKKYKRRVRKTRADKLVILNEIPKSGKAREAGFDGKYAMETTSIHDTDFTLCAKATRGLIMLDNEMLKKCGGRAKGWPRSSTKK